MENGFKKAEALKGGFNAWVEAGGELVKA